MTNKKRRRRRRRRKIRKSFVLKRNGCDRDVRKEDGTRNRERGGEGGKKKEDTLVRK